MSFVPYLELLSLHVRWQQRSRFALLECAFHPVRRTELRTIHRSWRNQPRGRFFLFSFLWPRAVSEVFIMSEEKMSEAVLVRNVYKKFADFVSPLWKRNILSGTRNGWTEEHGTAFPAIERAVLENVSFSVSAGEIFALVGAENAGKTTLIRLLSGQLPPDRGEISHFGWDVLRQVDHVQSLLNPIAGGVSFFRKYSSLITWFTLRDAMGQILAPRARWRRSIYLINWEWLRWKGCVRWNSWATRNRRWLRWQGL